MNFENTETNKPLLYQIRVDISEQAALILRENKIAEFDKGLLNILDNINGSLICQFDAFYNFVKECEQEESIDSPLYKWTKDTIENKETYL